MANDSQNTAPQDTNPASGNELKTYTTIPRTWAQLRNNTHPSSISTSDSRSDLLNQATTSSSITTSNPTQYSHINHQNSTDTSNLPTPMTRWLAETQRQTSYNTIHSVENTHARQGHAVEGGERMERDNGGNERGAEDNWSMERNGQSERWA